MLVFDEQDREGLSRSPSIDSMRATFDDELDRESGQVRESGEDDKFSKKQVIFIVLGGLAVLLLVVSWMDRRYKPPEKEKQRKKKKVKKKIKNKSWLDDDFLPRFTNKTTLVGAGVAGCGCVAALGMNALSTPETTKESDDWWNTLTKESDGWWNTSTKESDALTKESGDWLEEDLTTEEIGILGVTVAALLGFMGGLGVLFEVQWCVDVWDWITGWFGGEPTKSDASQTPSPNPAGPQGQSPPPQEQSQPPQGKSQPLPGQQPGGGQPLHHSNKHEADGSSDNGWEKIPVEYDKLGDDGKLGLSWYPRNLVVLSVASITATLKVRKNDVIFEVNYKEKGRDVHLTYAELSRMTFVALAKIVVDRAKNNLPYTIVFRRCTSTSPATIAPVTTFNARDTVEILPQGKSKAQTWQKATYTKKEKDDHIVECNGKTFRVNSVKNFRDIRKHYADNNRPCPWHQ